MKPADRVLANEAQEADARLVLAHRWIVLKTQHFTDPAGSAHRARERTRTRCAHDRVGCEASGRSQTRTKPADARESGSDRALRGLGTIIACETLENERRKRDERSERSAEHSTSQLIIKDTFALKSITSHVLVQL